MEIKNSFSFLTLGKTVENTGSFKRYVGVGASYPIALNPTKKELEAIYGREVANEPEYFGVDDEGVKYAHLDFYMKTDPELCNGIEIITRARFTIRNDKYYKADKSGLRVIDKFGNSVWATEEDAKAHKKLFNASGTESKIADYRIARVKEPELCDFLRKLINVKDAFEYNNGTWSLRKLKHESEVTAAEASNGKVLTYEDCMVSLENEDFDKFFKGDTKELWDYIKSKMELVPLRINLLYGVRTTEEGKQYQDVCTGYDMMLRANANAKAFARLEEQLTNAKNHGMYANTEYKVQPLAEYTVEPTNLETPAAEETGSGLPWD